MARWICECGEQIRSSGPVPHPYEWLAISDVEYGNTRDVQNSIDAEVLYRKMLHLWRCPNSDHLWVFWDGVHNPPTLYEPKHFRWREEGEGWPEIETLVVIVRQSLQSNNSSEDVLKALRREGANKNDSIRAMEIALGIGFGKAREMVERSETWSDQLTHAEKGRYEFFDEVRGESI